MRVRRTSSDSTTNNFSVLGSIMPFLEMVSDAQKIQFAGFIGCLRKHISCLTFERRGETMDFFLAAFPRRSRPMVAGTGRFRFLCPTKEFAMTPKKQNQTPIRP